MKAISDGLLRWSVCRSLNPDAAQRRDASEASVDHRAGIVSGSGPRDQRMATPIRLRALTRAERRLLRAKLKDLSLSAVPAGRGRGLLRRMGPPGSAPHRRRRLSSPSPAGASARDLASPARHRAVPRLLRRPCRLPQRDLSAPQTGARGQRGLPAAPCLLPRRGLFR
jgi:hypothetical protein